MRVATKSHLPTQADTTARRPGQPTAGAPADGIRDLVRSRGRASAIFRQHRDQWADPVQTGVGLPLSRPAPGRFGVRQADRVEPCHADGTRPRHVPVAGGLGLLARVSPLGSGRSTNQRAYGAGLAGVSCVSDTICMDDVARHAEATVLYDEAYAFVRSTVGAFRRGPRVIFCSTQTCFRSFGFDRAVAQAVGVSGIVLGPRGWKDYYLRHEMIHHLQAERLGVIRQWLMPGWFTEGMAYAFSQDPRPVLADPWQEYRAAFESWYQVVGKDDLWVEARALRPRLARVLGR